jgi:hypothetical protein
MKNLTLRLLAVASTFAMLAVADAAAAQTTPAPAAGQEPAAQATAPRQERARAPRIRRDVISQEEIAGSGATNLYEVVQRLRPGWLRSGNVSNIRGGGTGVVVYQNNTPLGGPEALRQLTPGYAASLRFLEGNEASNTLPGLGSRTVAGAIVVVLPGTGGR